MDAAQAPSSAAPARGLTLAALAAIGAALGLAGIEWGLPSLERVLRVQPPALESEAFHRRLEGTWAELHQRLGPNLMVNPESFSRFDREERIPAGWTEPPAPLMNPLRSFHLRTALDDEQTYLLLLSRMRPWKLQFHPHMFTYGGAHVYAYGAALGAAALTGFARLRGGLAPYLEDPGAMARLYLVGRLLSFAAYLGAAWLLLRIGERSFGRAAGALAALFYLACPAALVNEHTVKAHCFWAFFALLTLERSLALLETGGDRAYAAAGAAAGATVGSFLQGWPACLVVAAAACARRLSGRARAWAPELRGLTIAALISVLVFLITNPYWLLDSREALAEMRVLSGWSGVYPLNPVLFLFGPIRRSTTSAVWALVLLGALWGLTRPRKEPSWFLCAAGFWIALAAAVAIGAVRETAQSRYFLGWLGIGFLLAARTIVELVGRLPFGGARRAAWAAVAALGVNALLLGATYTENYRAASTSIGTLQQAGDWIDARLSPRQEIGLVHFPAPANVPYFRLDRHALRLIPWERFAAAGPRKLPEFLVLLRAYDEPPEAARPNFARYERVAAFERPRLVPWLKVDPTATPANPEVDVYRLRPS